MRLFRLTGDMCGGAEFEVEDDATEEQIADAAFDCAAEYLDYGWQEAKDEPEKSNTRKRSSK